MSAFSFRRRVASLFGVLAIAAAACSEKSNPEPPGERVTMVPADAPDPGAGPAAPAAVNAPAPNDEAALDAVAAALIAFVQERLERELTSSRREQDGLASRIESEGVFRDVLQEAYRTRDYAPFFFGSEASERQRAAMQAALVALPEHGLSQKPYDLPRLEQLSASLAEAQQQRTALRAGAELDGTQRALFALAMGYERVPDRAQARRDLAALNLKGPKPEHVGLLRDPLRIYLDAGARVQQVEQQIDVHLLKAFFRYALDFKYLRRAHPDEPTPEPEKAPLKFKEDLLVDLDGAFPDVGGRLAAFAPDHPHYRKLIEGLAFYKGLADAGTVAPLKGPRLRKKAKGDKVLALKQRLVLEGYDVGPIDDQFDDALDAAVRAYQVAHQLEANGIVTGAFYAALNVPMKHRVSQIRLALQRWRESPLARGVDRPSFYARVNIPQFVVQFFEDDTVVREHRVVVGTNAHDIDLLAGVEGRINHTRILAAEFNQIVLNPYWFVPPRIHKFELDFERERDPKYYENNRFEFVQTSSGQVFVKQAPGPDNALGVVKFLFANPYSIYMHDTPKKPLFNRVVRAFSHGCIRLENPVDVAKWLLQRSNGMAPEKVDSILATRRETPIDLTHKVPIYIEYVTVSVDGAGHLMFLGDVYGYDRAYANHELPVSRGRNIPEARLAKLRGEDDVRRAAIEAKIAADAAAAAPPDGAAPAGDGAAPPPDGKPAGAGKPGAPPAAKPAAGAKPAADDGNGAPLPDGP